MDLVSDGCRQTLHRVELARLSAHWYLEPRSRAAKAAGASPPVTCRPSGPAEASPRNGTDLS